MRMRTTLRIDDDVLVAIRERARRERRSAGAVLSELAREALTRQHRQDLTPRMSHLTPLPRRGATVSNALIDRLRAEAPE